MANNPFQRNRVSKSGSIYSLLKEDILSGCIIPPIVLASTHSHEVGMEDVTEAMLNRILEQYSDVKILDGLQRTLSLIEVYKNNVDYFEQLQEPYQLRVEIYLSISDTGILYRMLTLNTGQTPMSLRHQLEILFSKYLDNNLGEINIIKDVDDESVKSIKDFKFSDLIEGYNSLLEMNEFPIDRFDILQTVKTIDFISKEHNDILGFKNFVELYYEFVKKTDNNNVGWEYPDEELIPAEYKTNGNPYGKTVYRIFNKSQSLTGFGAAVADLIEQEIINGTDDLYQTFNKIDFCENDLIILNKCLDDVREKSKKIGNGQRMFFKYFFKNLLDKDGSNYCKVEESLAKAKSRTLAEV
ncbi:hypothetical protein ACK35E_18140 [Aeromonas veronii]